MKYIKKLEGHSGSVYISNYFINNKDNIEYLISADCYKFIIIWDITHNYNIKYKIFSEYDFNIIICLLIFPIQQENNYIVLGEDKNYNNNGRKLYSLNTGDCIKILHDVDNNIIFYILLWLNKRNDKYYLIQFLEEKLQINDLLEGDLYTELKHQLSISYLSGFIYSKDNIDYLCSTTSFSKKDICGYINIWDLINKNIVKIIKDKNGFDKIINWNKKYSISISKALNNKSYLDDDNNMIKIIDMENFNIISNIKPNLGIKYLKKMYHPTYGEVLLYLNSRNNIELLKI